MTQSIGTILRRARERRRLTQDDVSSYIKIPNKYLRAMESDDYAIFSDKVHAKGFLKLYSDFLNLNTLELSALWRREYEKIFDSKVKNLPPVSKPIEYPKYFITPSMLFVSFIFICVLGFFGYLYYQYRNYTGAPNLLVYSPKENLVVEKDVLDITGTTDLDAEIFINNQKIVLNPDASFAESIKLKEGLNTISIKSLNKLGKQTEFIRTIIYRPVFQAPVVDLNTLETTSSVLPATSSPVSVLPETKANL